ncbi:MAG: hypothetical protein LBG60_05560 [Bifidobacteriaceae bacterium]|nr:hypothetical protein [Bifidobacteriaceae bacterium]
MPNNELGDFQTPDELATACLKVLRLPSDARILEPTCGRGSFLRAAAALSPRSERLGIEIQEEYARQAAAWGKVQVGSVFAINLAADLRWQSRGQLFVVGNPPWVTSAELNRMGSANLPRKENFKGAKGLDAVLGSANFDVCEYIILKALNEIRSQFTLGMLCKTQVARNVMEFAASAHLPVAASAIYRIDARRWFGAGVDACWLTVAVDASVACCYETAVYDDAFNPGSPPACRFGVVDGLMVADVDKYKPVRDADGKCPYEWRSGLKHDASSVFELVATPAPVTREGVPLDLEADCLFPLLKGTDVFRGRHRELTKWVIVPQRTFGEDTASLKRRAPKTWSYLNARSEVLDGRKSSIYRNRPRFSVFGHGDYTYAPYKVAVSGLHKTPIFRLIVPIGGKPVVLDDTCYFLPFSDITEALLVTAALNSPECVELIESLVFWDSKRPITKRLLARIDLGRLPFDRTEVLRVASGDAKLLHLPFDDARAASVLRRLNPVRELADTLF